MAIGQLEHEGKFLILDVAGQSTVDAIAMTGQPIDFFFAEEECIVGNAICSKNNWDFENDGDAIATRLGSFDLAGNFSGMIEALTVEPGCGCVVAGDGPSNHHGWRLRGLGSRGVSHFGGNGLGISSGPVPTSLDSEFGIA